MKPEDQVYQRVAMRDSDPFHHGNAQWNRAGLYVTLVLARIARQGPAR